MHHDFHWWTKEQEPRAVVSVTMVQSDARRQSTEGTLFSRGGRGDLAGLGFLFHHTE